MDKAQVTAAMKKNIVSILAGVVALVAIGVMIFWVAPQREELRTQVEARAAKAGEIQNLMSRQRQDINITASGSRGEGEQLTSFPTPTVITRGRDAMNRVKQQASGVLEQAVAANRRVPLGYSPDQYEQAAAAWPLEGEQNKINRDRYAREYARYINADNTFNNGQYPQNTLPREARGTRPPSPEEVSTTLSGLTARLTAEAPTNSQGQPLNPEQLQQTIADRSANLATQMKYDRARGHLMYVEPNTSSSGFTVHPLASKIRPGDNPTMEEIWNAQVGLWAQQTVVRNLRRGNEQDLSQLPSEQQNILNAPIKHLVWISVPTTFVDTAGATGGQGGGGGMGGGMGGLPPGYGAYGGYGGYPGMEGMDPMMDPGLGGFGGPAPGGAGGGGEPAAPAADAELSVDAGAQLEPNYAHSPTGRPPHTPFYDVIRFEVTLRCDASRVPYVIEQLQRGALLTVTNVEMTMVDLATAAREGYVYGDHPVAQLKLNCEMLLLRNWTVALMPTSVKQALASWTDPAAGTGGTGGTGGGGYGDYGDYGGFGY